MIHKDKTAYIVILITLIALLQGCAVNRATATVDQTTDLSTLKVFYVKKYSEDTRDTNVLIQDKLVEMGFQVSEAETNVDAIVTYVDKWFWDITMYMLELTITIREPNTDFPLATGNSYHTSMTRKSPEGMVDEVLTNIFFSAQKQGDESDK
jgi:type IV pilus biogenesis protein CpaD/CtpE